MLTFTSQIALVLLLLLYATTFHTSMSSNHKVVRCNDKDRGTLLIFKKGIIDPSDHLSTWSTEEDCCAWKGVHCDNITGRVLKLDLKPSQEEEPYEGEINFSVLELEFLNYLDLSGNEFNVTSIPPIGHNVTHNSNLLYLDLSYNYGIGMDNLHWLSRLSSLKYLYLSGIDLHNETDWLRSVAILPSLSELRLSGCNLNNFSASLMYVNFTSLVTLDLSANYFNSKLPYRLFNLSSGISYLDLSANYFNSKLPYWLFNLSSGISYLDLSMSNIHGEIPASLLNLRNLTHLDISHNQLNGSIPDWIGQRTNLTHLGLSDNMFHGSIPSTLGNLSSLVSLGIGSKYLSGVISETTFSKLSNLKYLDLSNSPFEFHFDPEWIPPFQLNSLFLQNTNQGPGFPSWIYTQKSLQELDLSSSRISLACGDKFRRLVEGTSYLHLSNNSISGDISNVTLNSTELALDRNNFTGGLPHISPMADYVDLSHNSFSGSIPRGWDDLKRLYYINLWNNKLRGEVLVHLSNSKQLQYMVLGKNNFSGTIPIKMPQYLEVIVLRDNQFVGNIPPQLLNLSHLYHLDLAYNEFSGSMPHCVYNLTQMVTFALDSWFYQIGIIDLFTKGHDYEYVIYPNRRTIDLSSNNLSGEIPLELFRLTQVQTLNLSHNNLSGKIPKMIGAMKNLESLDLSNNKLSGEVPQSMALLTFLEYLNLSCNNFIGRIPTGTQLQSFNASSYIENPKLCGAPLKNCSVEEKNPKSSELPAWNEDGDPLIKSLYLGMGVGFAAGFWGICGSLFLIRKWRHTCFRFLDLVTDQLYVTLMVKLNRFCEIWARTA